MWLVSNYNNNISINSTIIEQGMKRIAISYFTDNVTSPNECRGSSNNDNNLCIVNPPNVPKRIVTAYLV